MSKIQFFSGKAGFWFGVISNLVYLYNTYTVHELLQGKQSRCKASVLEIAMIRIYHHTKTCIVFNNRLNFTKGPQKISEKCFQCYLIKTKRLVQRNWWNVIRLRYKRQWLHYKNWFCLHFSAETSLFFNAKNHQQPE